RPTTPTFSPEKIKSSLTSDQYKLYKLIWERFIASQMENAVFNTSSVDIEANGYIFKASGYSVKFDGFTKLYEETSDNDTEENNNLPILEEGEALKLKSLQGNQHFTQPPARFTEASLIKALEENGIGRPSTYAPTISTILSRGYIERDGKTLKPTALGDVTTELMCEQFPDIVNVEFTAKMEDDLDEIEVGKEQWEKVIDDFYHSFSATLEKAEKNMNGTHVKLPVEETDVVCENCGRKMVIKTGRFGRFLACPGYPECKNTKPITKSTDGICPKCGGVILAKKSKKGKAYFGCEHNPKCDFMTWDTPLKETCPKCGSTLFRKYGKNGKIYCAKDGCGYEK
ncbi:MAG: type I DNA topoisomerase, partial [Ruminococcaceae bacterium]|nr:type I DNA topoisomerase [Oscillospiraceae bacterium]